MSTRTRRWWWPLGEPAFPLTVAGHGRIHHAHLPKPRRLLELVGHQPREWGLLLVIDGRGRRWTLYSPDPDYTALFAPTAHTLMLRARVFEEKFPGWSRGWRLS